MFPLSTAVWEYELYSKLLTVCLCHNLLLNKPWWIESRATSRLQQLLRGKSLQSKPSDALSLARFLLSGQYQLRTVLGPMRSPEIIWQIAFQLFFPLPYRVFHRRAGWQLASDLRKPYCRPLDFSLSHQAPTQMSNCLLL